MSEAVGRGQFRICAHQPLLFPLGSATERLPLGILHTAFYTLVAPKLFQISLFAGSLGDYNSAVTARAP